MKPLSFGARTREKEHQPAGREDLRKEAPHRDSIGTYRFGTTIRPASERPGERALGLYRAQQ